MKRAPAAALALLAAALAAWLVWSRQNVQRSDSTGLRDPVPPTGSQPFEPAAEKPAPAPAAATQEPLPPSTAPLRESFALLDAQARRGNGEAACRLVLEIDRCARTRGLAQRSTPLARRLELIETSRFSDAEKEQRRALARSEAAALDVDLTHCEGFDPQQALPSMRYLAVAASRGHRPSRLLYLMPTSLVAADLIRDPALAAEYRITAPALFREALEAGDADLLLPWSLAAEGAAHSPLASLLPEPFRRPELVQALRAELEAAGHAVPPRLTDAMVRPPSPTSEDVREARALFDAHFRGATEPPLRFLDYLTTENLRCEELSGR